MEKVKEKMKKVLKNPLWIVDFLVRKRILFMSDEKYLKFKYYLVFNKKLDLENPKTFNEKLQWLKLNDRQDIYTTMVDKYEAKKYVANIIGEEYIIPTYGVYDKFDDIDFEKLPDQFVIKCTHSGGNNGVYVIKNKKETDFDKIRKNINKILKKNLYYYAREWPYKNVKPRIIIEKLLENSNSEDLVDYKFQTFNGKVVYCLICTERRHKVKFTFMDKNKKFIDVTQDYAKNDSSVCSKLPDNYDKMVKLSEKLSKDLTEVRVDFYSVNNKIYFGELTLFEDGGFGILTPDIWDLKFGNMLKLPLDD